MSSSDCGVLQYRGALPERCTRAPRALCVCRSAGESCLDLHRPVCFHLSRQICLGHHGCMLRKAARMYPGRDLAPLLPRPPMQE